MLELADEFLIAAYVDGDVTAEGRARVEFLLAESEEARRLHREYKQLGGLLRFSRETPAVDWADMRGSINNLIEDHAPAREMEGHETSAAERAVLDDLEIQVDARGTSRRSFWASHQGAKVMRRVALAAALVLALGVGWEFSRTAGVFGTGAGGNTVAVTPDSPGEAAVAASGTIEIGVGLGAGAGGGIEVGVGPAPAIAGEFPSLKMSHQELYPKYGRVEVRPEVRTAKTRDGELPF